MFTCCLLFSSFCSFLWSLHVTFLSLIFSPYFALCYLSSLFSLKSSSRKPGLFEAHLEAPFGTLSFKKDCELIYWLTKLQNENDYFLSERVIKFIEVNLFEGTCLAISWSAHWAIDWTIRSRLDEPALSAIRRHCVRIVQCACQRRNLDRSRFWFGKTPPGSINGVW